MNFIWTVVVWDKCVVAVGLVGLCLNSRIRYRFVKMLDISATELRFIKFDHVKLQHPGL